MSIYEYKNSSFEHAVFARKISYSTDKNLHRLSESLCKEGALFNCFDYTLHWKGPSFVSELFWNSFLARVDSFSVVGFLICDLTSFSYNHDHYRTSCKHYKCYPTINLHTKFYLNRTMEKCWIPGEFRLRNANITNTIKKIILHTKLELNRTIGKFSKTGGKVREAEFRGDGISVKICKRKKYQSKTNLHTKYYPNQTIETYLNVRGGGSESDNNWTNNW